ncbi:hypothetical protein [Actinacidiphila glaucinigra]|uniref:hypothetical protein n=1 Tax=Actinacidiphila glaucinigra TaxID=235986 RepID=UPI0035DEE066
MSDGTLYGLASLVLGGAFSMGVAWVSRPKQEQPKPAGEGPDLSTVAGLADAVVALHERGETQDERITELEEAQRQDRLRIGAFRRYLGVLQTALRRAGLPVPEPAPEDRELING